MLARLVWVCDWLGVAGWVSRYMLSLLISPPSAYWVYLVALVVALFVWLMSWCMWGGCCYGSYEAFLLQ